MSPDTNPSRPSEVPSPKTRPEISPVIRPENPSGPSEEPETIPQPPPVEKPPVEIPPEEVPETGLAKYD